MLHLSRLRTTCKSVQMLGFIFRISISPPYSRREYTTQTPTSIVRPPKRGRSRPIHLPLNGVVL